VPVNSQIDTTDVFDNVERESDEEVYGKTNADSAIKETNEKDLAREVYNKDLIEAGIDDWRLLLVNADNPVPDDYTFELSNIDNIRKFDSRAIDHLEKLIEDCRRETRDVIWAQSTYRDENEQNTVFNNKVQEYMDLGNSREEAEKLAATVTSRPGTSEHHVGLAVDFNYAKTDFENTAAFKWLAKNAHKYGFILRYPKGKESITNIVYEPWHFRYVGKEHAEVIKSKGFCLEEYINYLIYQVQN
jgi:D-alanyl-D-alanine carboxypeptidase